MVLFIQCRPTFEEVNIVNRYSISSQRYRLTCSTENAYFNSTDLSHHRCPNGGSQIGGRPCKWGRQYLNHFKISTNKLLVWKIIGPQLKLVGPFKWKLQPGWIAATENMIGYLCGWFRWKYYDSMKMYPANLPHILDEILGNPFQI